MTDLNRIHDKVAATISTLPDFVSILIVDDQRFDRLRLERFCNAMDFEAHVVQADCLETMGTRLQGDTFDLILLDYNLPDGNGLQAVDAIRHDPKNRNAAIIMVTGDGQDEIAVKALKNGCSDYITKDELSPESFRRATVNALQKSSLTIGIEAQSKQHQQVQQILQSFSTECAKEIKPVVSRMMRQLREFRDAASFSEEQLAQKQARIENSCMRLWEFLEDLERYQGTDAPKPAITAGPRAMPAATDDFQFTQAGPPMPAVRPKRVSVFGRPARPS